MSKGDLNESNIKNWVFLSISPVIVLAASVWFSEDKIAIKLAYIFQIYISLLSCFISGFLWSQSNIFKFKLIKILSFLPLFMAVCAGLISLYINPVFGLLIILIITLSFLFFKLPNPILILFPIWLRQLLIKSNVMICICLVTMIAFWLNPYSNPLNIYLN